MASAIASTRLSATVDRVSDLVSPGVRWCVEHGMQMRIVAARPIELDPDNLVDAAFLAQQCDLLGARRLRALTDLFRDGSGGLTATLTAALERDDRPAIRHAASVSSFISRRSSNLETLHPFA